MELLLHEKNENLKTFLRRLGSTAIAFSGGVDSTFLLKTAHDVLGDAAIAVTVISCFFPDRERREAENFCKENGIRQFTLEANELEIEGISRNPPNRCYLCKKDLFRKIKALAKAQGIESVCEGTNMDDLSDYRPGLQAIRELGIISPLQEAALNKSEIRVLSRELSLPTWEKPSFACLASRFPYGETLTEEKLSMVEKAEQFLLDLGLTQLRVRIHGTLARIEAEPKDMPGLAVPETARKINDYLRSLGFSYVTLDLMGYRTGSMNEVLEGSLSQSRT